MANSFYTVSLLLQDGTNQVSRYFNTAKAARKWASFCLTLGEIAEVSVYRGSAGADLIERRGK